MPATLESLPVERHSRSAVWLVALLVAFVSSAPFVRSLSYPFLAWDDDVNFASVAAIRSLDVESLRWMWSNFHVGHYAPLTWMSCALDFERGGDAPARALHETNLVLHGATAAALFGALYELLGRCGVAWRARLSAATLAAMAWGVHPLRTESVVWLTERRDVLSGLFYALATWTWLLSRRPGARRAPWLALSLLTFAAALLSKVSGVGLPLVFLALDAWPLKRLREAPRAALLEKLPYFALAIGGAALGVLGQRESTQVLASADELGLVQRAAIACYAVVFYVWKTLAPFGLSPLYELPQSISVTAPRFLVPLVLVPAVSLALFALRGRSALFAAAGTALLAFLLLLAPVSGLAHAGRQIAADRYTYLPSFAIAALLAAALAHWSSRASLAAAGVVCVALASASWRQTGVWSDTTTLFERAVAVEPNAYWANHKLGILHHQAGRFEPALEHYGRALATRPSSGNSDAHYDRALTHLRRNDLAAARADLEATLADAPGHAPTHAVLNDLDRRDGRSAASLERLARAFELAPSAELGAQRASLLIELGRVSEALTHAEQLRTTWPDDVRGHRASGMALMHLGRMDEAERALRRASELEPSPVTLFNLGVSVERQGRAEEARTIFRAVLALDPSNSRARAKLGLP